MDENGRNQDEISPKRFKDDKDTHIDGRGDKKDAMDGDKCYFRSYADIGIHEEMIADRVRTSTYRLAILKNYEAIRGKVVLDVGAGTGILSMFCIQAGAQRVYAMEASDMASQAELVFQKNGAADKVTLLKGKVEEVEVPEKVDVIVSEWMGYCLLYEAMLPSVIYARDKWLKKGGLMLPGTAVLYMAPLSDYEVRDRLRFWDSVDNMYEVDMSSIKPYASECIVNHVSVQAVDPEGIMAHAEQICSLDLHNVSKDDLQKVKGQFCFDCFGQEEIHGFATWFDVKFNKGVTLSTSPYKPCTHWQQSILYLEKPLLRVQQGTLIEGTIELSPNEKYQRFLDISLSYRVDGVEHKKKYLMDDFFS